MLTASISHPNLLKCHLRTIKDSCIREILSAKVSQTQSKRYQKLSRQTPKTPKAKNASQLKPKLTNSENQYEKNQRKSLTQFSLNDFCLIFLLTFICFFLSFAPFQIHLQSIHNWHQQSQQMEHVDASARIQQTHSKNTKLQNEVA